MPSKATTVEGYLAELPPDRRSAIETVRKVFRDNLGKGYEERMQYGMIGYCVPHSVFPAGYHCDPKQPLPFAGLASQKGHMSLYLMGLYMSPRAREAFETAWKKAGKKLDMGKSCVRFKKIEDLALDVLAATLRSMPCEAFVEQYQSALDGRGGGGASGSAPSKGSRPGRDRSHSASSAGGKSATRKTPEARSKKASKKAGGRSTRA